MSDRDNNAFVDRMLYIRWEPFAPHEEAHVEPRLAVGQYSGSTKVPKSLCNQCNISAVPMQCFVIYLLKKYIWAQNKLIFGIYTWNHINKNLVYCPWSLSRLQPDHLSGVVWHYLLLAMYPFGYFPWPRVLHVVLIYQIPHTGPTASCSTTESAQIYLFNDVSNPSSHIYHVIILISFSVDKRRLVNLLLPYAPESTSIWLSKHTGSHHHGRTQHHWSRSSVSALG